MKLSKELFLGYERILYPLLISKNKRLINILGMTKERFGYAHEVEIIIFFVQVFASWLKRRINDSTFHLFPSLF
jgi:hypothetical protein